MSHRGVLVLVGVIAMLLLSGGRSVVWLGEEEEGKPEWARDTVVVGNSGLRGGTNRDASNDDTVQRTALAHDSRARVYRLPQGAVPMDTTVTLRLRAASGDLTAAKVRVWNARFNQEATYDMERVAAEVNEGSNRYEYWEATLPSSSSPTIYWYRFLAIDGSATVYYEDDRALDGGMGRPYVSSPDHSWQLTLYDPGFSTPDWVKNAVIYQIFPDRFRDGDSTNNPSSGEFFYGSYDTIYRSGHPEDGWNEHICDPNDVSGSVSTCPGVYSQNFYGGDLQGIIDKLDYLENLGITAIYLNPIFESPSNHKYDTTDYFHVDENFGALSTLQTLFSEAHRRGIKVILDGVFNHSSSDSYYFDRYDRWNGTAPGPSEPPGSPVQPGTSADSGACETTDSSVSPYVEWYSFTSSASAPCSDGRDYSAWFGFDSLPTLRHDNPAVRDYFIDNGTDAVGPYWIAQGADGWRLDVSPLVDGGQVHEPSDDYWEDFRDAIRAQDADAYIVGEEWGNATSWTIGAGNASTGEWDATMNYPFGVSVLGFWREEELVDNDHNSGGNLGPIRPLTPTELNRQILNRKERYPPEAWRAMMNLFDSHDTNRVLFLLDPNVDQNSTALYNDPSYDWSPAISRLKGAVLMQMTLPGAPTIYYGDEVGTVNPPAYTRTWQDDPYNRAPYPWTDASGTPYYSHMPDEDLRRYYETMIGIRAQNPALRTGSFDPLLTADNKGVYVYGRKMSDDTNAALVLANHSASPQRVTLGVEGYLPTGASLTDAVNGGTVTVAAAGSVAVDVPAQGGAVLIASDFSGQRPGCVTSVSGAAPNPSHVDLSWAAGSAADVYAVYRSRLQGGGYRRIATTTGTEYADSSVAAGRSYFYRVEGIDAETRLSAERCRTEASATVPRPVQMQSFRAKEEGGEIRLTWTTTREFDNSGFRVQRRVSGVADDAYSSSVSTEFRTVGRVPGGGTTDNSRTYDFTDSDLPYAADTLHYRLKQFEGEGTEWSSHEVEVVREPRTSFEVQTPRPNPAQTRAILPFSVPENAGGPVHLALYDLLGRQVRMLERNVSSGRHTAEIDVGSLAAGTYFVRLITTRGTHARKLVVVR